MNDEILHRLRLTGEGSAEVPVRILDMDVAGATLRSVARRLPWARTAWDYAGPWQIEHGRQINESCAAGNMALVLGDYEHTELPLDRSTALCAGEQLLCAWREQIGISAGVPSAAAAGRAGCLWPMDFWGLKAARPQKLVCRKLCDCWAD